MQEYWKKTRGSIWVDSLTPLFAKKTMHYFVARQCLHWGFWHDTPCQHPSAYLLRLLLFGLPLGHVRSESSDDRYIILINPWSKWLQYTLCRGWKPSNRTNTERGSRKHMENKNCTNKGHILHQRIVSATHFTTKYFLKRFDLHHGFLFALKLAVVFNGFNICYINQFEWWLQNEVSNICF